MKISNSVLNHPTASHGQGVDREGGKDDRKERRKKGGRDYIAWESIDLGFVIFTFIFFACETGFFNRALKVPIFLN